MAAASSFPPTCAVVASTTNSGSGPQAQRTTQMHTLSSHSVSSIAALANGRCILGVDEDSKRSITHGIDCPSFNRVKSSTNKLQLVAITPDQRVFSLSQKTGDLYEVDPDSCKEKESGKLCSLGYDKKEEPIDMQADNDRLYLTSSHVIHIVNLKEIEEESRFGRIVRATKGEQKAIALGTDRLFVGACLNKRQAVVMEYTLENLGQPKCVHFEDDEDWGVDIHKMLYDQEHQRLWVASDNNLRVWDPLKHELRKKLDTEKAITALTVKEYVVYAGKCDGAVELLNANDYTHLRTLNPIMKRTIRALAIHRGEEKKDQVVVAATKDGTCGWRL